MRLNTARLGKASRLGVVGAALSSLALLSACGGSHSSGGTSSGGAGTAGNSSPPAMIKEAVARYNSYLQAVPAFDAPGPAFDASKAKGKTVWYVPTSYSIPIFHVIFGELSSALARVGVSARVCDGQGNPTDINQCISQAVAQRAGAIIADSEPAAIIAASLMDAKSHNIPVIAGNDGDPSDPIAADVAANVAFPYSMIGQLVADGIIRDSGGKGNVLVLGTSDTPETSALINRGMLAEFKANCPQCKVATKLVAVADWGTQLQSLTQSTLLASPQTKYVVAEFDAMSAFVIPALAQAANHVALYTENADLQQMQDLKAGRIAVDVGSSPSREAWAFADESLRLISGVAPVTESVPVRVFDRSNIGGLTLDQPSLNNDSWYGPASYRADYEGTYQHLWHSS